MESGQLTRSLLRWLPDNVLWHITQIHTYILHTHIHSHTYIHSHSVFFFNSVIVNNTDEHICTLTQTHKHLYTPHIPAIFSAVYSVTMRIRSISTIDSNTRPPAPTTQSHCSWFLRILSNRVLGTPVIEKKIKSKAYMIIGLLHYYLLRILFAHVTVIIMSSHSPLLQ